MDWRTKLGIGIGICILLACLIDRYFFIKRSLK
jgi:hypothetical protein